MYVCMYVCTVLCKSNESEFPQKSAFVLKNFAGNITDFSKEHSYRLSENSNKNYAGQSKIRNTERKFEERNFQASEMSKN